ncbi:MAG: DinB family protein [Acidobacteriia bacterium]|nr:DinB family protein [Terriglobia bacterium]
MANPTTSFDTAQLLKLLEDTRREVHAAVEGLGAAEACACPAPGRWSALECLEHVTTVEQRLLGRLQNAVSSDNPATEVPAMDKQREAALLEQISSRVQRVEAPELARPSGRYVDLSEALAAFDAARAHTVSFAQANHSGLYSIAESHPRFGLLNGYEFVTIIAAHSRRHSEQLREVRGAVAD